MKLSGWKRLLAIERLNFLVTNRVPRLLLTRCMGWYSAIDSPRLTRLSIAVWRLFTELDLSDAQEKRFSSLKACFTRSLVDGARPIDMAGDVMTSPCDAIVGACGFVNGTRVFQAKGYPYSTQELMGPTQTAAEFAGGVYVTLRLTSAMYHRFHAPVDGVLTHVTYISGDTWNVNPPALARIDRLYCRNERAVIRCRSRRGAHDIVIVPVAAILVASIRLHFIDVLLHLRYRGPNEIPCDVPVHKGKELGWFEHGSTIIVFAPEGFALMDGIAPGLRIRMGQALMRIP